MHSFQGKLVGHLLAGATIFVWGTTFIASKVLLREFSTLQVMVIRFAIAYLTLLLIGRKRQKTTLREEFNFLFLAVSGTTLYFLFENQALVVTFASNVSILLSVAPILTAILAHFFTKDEKIHGFIMLGSLIAFAGVVLVVFNGTVVLQLNPLGDILCFGAALCWAAYSICLKRTVGRYDPIFLTRKVLLYSILTTLPLLLIEHRPIPFAQFRNGSSIFSFLFLGVLGSGICYVTWNIAARKLGIVATNNYIYLSPFVTMVAAALLLDEPVTVMGMLGALLIVAGVVVAGIKKRGSAAVAQAAAADASALDSPEIGTEHTKPFFPVKNGNKKLIQKKL